MNDTFFKEGVVEKKSMNNVETVEEKRVRLTKNIISEYAADEKTDFFATLTARTTDHEIMTTDDNQLTTRMKMHMLEQKGKLFYKLADDFCSNAKWEENEKDENVMDMDRVFIKGHKQAITSLNWSLDNKYIITSSKDCQLIKCKYYSLIVFRGSRIIEKKFFQRRKI